MTSFTTVKDLRNWVDERIGDYPAPDDVDRVTEIIQRDPNRPGWGEDWTEYLDSLPMLVELLPGPHATSYNEITGLQRMSIRMAAERVGTSENDMAKFFVDGGEWDCAPGLELENELVECWNESIRENN